MNAPAIYLDHNATTRPLPQVIDAVAQALTQTWANPSSQHELGQQARSALMQARAAVARMVNCKPAEVVFTSGATEAYAMALRGAVGFNGRHALVISEAEHSSARKLGTQLSKQAGTTVRWVGLMPDGSLDMVQAREFIRDDVSLVSVMAANNETGVLMPLGELARLAHAQGALLHVDATQQIGKLPFDFAACGADLVSLSAHKFGGPKGVGALLIRQGLNWPSMWPGSQERARRGGTENLPGIAGMATAAQALMLSPEAWLARAAHMAQLRDQLEQGLAHALPGVQILGEHAPRLPNTTMLRFGSLHAEQVLKALEQLGVAASSGAACSSGGTEPSHVLLAMGLARDEALGAVRLSLGHDTTAADILSVLQHLPPLLAPLMQTSSFPLSSGQSAASPGVFA
jgi:cysteine desulfurase